MNNIQINEYNDNAIFNSFNLLLLKYLKMNKDES